MDSRDRTQRAILTAVRSFDGQLKGMRDHEERIKRLEDAMLATRIHRRRTRLGVALP